MRFGETFMLGGLTEVQDTAQTFKTPFLGEIPYLGAAFRRVSYQTTETELVILVTPVLAGAMQENQMPPGGPGMFTEQPTDRELYWYGMLESPSNGGMCPNCGPGGAQPHDYPAPILDFDMGKAPTPLISPVPVQELPPLHERFSPVMPGAPPVPPGPATGQLVPAAPMSQPAAVSTEPMNAPPVAPAPVAPTVPSTMIGPAPPGPSSMAPMQLPQSATQQTGPPPTPAGSASRWWYNPGVRQVGAQSPNASQDGATQATYSSATSTGLSSTAMPAPASNVPSTAVRSGLYEPQSGLYVPAGAGGP